MSYTFWEISRNGSSTPKGDRTYTKVYLVRSSVLEVTENDIVAALPVAYGDPHPSDSTAYLLSFDVKQSESDLTFWTATCQYTSNTDGAGGGNTNGVAGGGGAGARSDRGTMSPGTVSTPPSERGGNSSGNTPTARPWVVKWGSRDREVLLQEDAEGTPVVNAAGQPFDPPITAPHANETLRITLFVETFDHVKIRTYKNHISNAAVFDYPARWAKCTDYTSTSVYENGAFFFQLDIEIEFQEDSWDVKVMNAGTMFKESNIKPLSPILDRTGHPITSPVPLKADGTGPLNAGDAPNYLFFSPFYEADFSSIF